MQVRSLHIRLLALLLVALPLSAPSTAITTVAAPPPRITSQNLSDFGPNVIIFDPTMPLSEIQATVDAIYARQVDTEMGTMDKVRNG